MACVLMPQCNFLYGYFWCQLPEDTFDVEVTFRTMKGNHTFKRDHATQVISCRPWTSQCHPYQSLARKMKTYLELKDQVADLHHPNPTYPKRPEMPSPQKAQASRNRMTKESKQRSRNHQANRRQNKVRLIEKPLVLSRALVTLIPTTTVTTTTTTPPANSSPMSAISYIYMAATSSATPKLFVSKPSSTSRTLEVPKSQILRSWPMPYNKEDTLMPVW